MNIAITTVIGLCTVSALAGFITSRALDTRTINQIKDGYNTLLKIERAKHHKVEARLFRLLAESQIQRAKAQQKVRRAPRNEDEAFFNDITSWSLDVDDNNNLFGGF